MLPQWKWYLSLKFLFNSSYLFWTPQLHYKISKFKFMIFIIIYLGVLNYNKCHSKQYPQCNSYQPQFTKNFSILQWKYNVATEKHYCFFVGYILYNFKMQEKYMKLIFRWFGCNKIYTPQSLINNFWSKLSPVISHFLCFCISSSPSPSSLPPSYCWSPSWSASSPPAKELWFQTRQVHSENCSSEYQESH